MKLSGCIIAYNEADRIERAIRSLGFCDEVVVLDSGSTDGTDAIAERLGAQVIRTDWPGHVTQKNRAIAACSGEWLVSIDADEWVSEALAQEIIAFLNAPASEAASVPRRNHWLGTALAHGRWYPDRHVRLALRKNATWTGQDPHDRLEAGTAFPLRHDLHHDPYRSLGEHLSTIDRYTRIAATQVKPRFFLFDLGVRPCWSFLRAYVLEQGFRDGLPGFVLAVLGAVYVVLKYARARGLP